jgi:hypothetical protein
MEILLYYVARFSFVVLALYGLFLIGGSTFQLAKFTSTERGRLSAFIAAQFLHGTLSLILGILLSYHLETAFSTSLILLILSWVYMTLEHFGRRWYTVRYLDRRGTD